MKACLEMMTMSAYPDQVVIKKEESSGDELQEDSSSSEEEQEEPEEEEKEDVANIDDNESSNSYSNALTTMDGGLRSHPEYQEDYWIGNSGASSHMVGEDKDLFTKTPIQGKVNTANGTSMPMVCKCKMNVEANPKQGKSCKGVLTVKVAKGMLHKLFSFTTALMHDWKMYGAKNENDSTEIKLTHQHFEPIVFDRVLRFDDAISLAARIKTLPKSLNLEGAHTATLEGSISKKMLHQVTGHGGQPLMTDTAKYYGVNVTGIVKKCLSCSLEKIRKNNIPKKNESTAKIPGERMYLDISSMKDETLGGRRHWAMLVDEATRCKHSFFLKKKSDQVDMVSSW